MPKIEIDGKLVDVIDCRKCARTVMVNGPPASGWIASCGQRLVNLSECGQADNLCKPNQ